MGFLCESSLVSYEEFKAEHNFPTKCGTYHLIHRIDSKIFAVSVLDLTPSVLSSVYLFYNPSFSFLNPGTLCAILEIEYMNKLKSLYMPTLNYYYMGFFIHNCQKSVYKGEFHPSELLCPLTYTWVDLDSVRENLKDNKFF